MDVLEDAAYQVCMGSGRAAQRLGGLAQCNWLPHAPPADLCPPRTTCAPHPALRWAPPTRASAARCGRRWRLRQTCPATSTRSRPRTRWGPASVSCTWPPQGGDRRLIMHCRARGATEPRTHCTWQPALPAQCAATMDWQPPVIPPPGPAQPHAPLLALQSAVPERQGWPRNGAQRGDAHRAAHDEPHHQPGPAVSRQGPRRAVTALPSTSAPCAHDHPQLLPACSRCHRCCRTPRALPAPTDAAACCRFLVRCITRRRPARRPTTCCATRRRPWSSWWRAARGCRRSCSPRPTRSRAAERSRACQSACGCGCCAPAATT